MELGQLLIILLQPQPMQHLLLKRLQRHLTLGTWDQKPQPAQRAKLQQQHPLLTRQLKQQKLMPIKKQRSKRHWTLTLETLGLAPLIQMLLQ